MLHVTVTLTFDVWAISFLILIEHCIDNVILQHHKHMLSVKGVLSENSFRPQKVSFSMGYIGDTLTGYCDVSVCYTYNIKTYLKSVWRPLYDGNLKNENIWKTKKTFFRKKYDRIRAFRPEVTSSRRHDI
jgi:hypothetical protein